MRNLYQVKSMYMNIMDMLEESEGELTENIQIALKEIEGDRDELIEAMLLQSFEEKYSQMMISDEIDRLGDIKESAAKREASLKRNVIDILKFFDLRSTNKKSPGYAFKGKLASCFTKTITGLVIDESQLVKFSPITGEKSDFVKYSTAVKLGYDDIKKLNDTGLVPITSYVTSVDKTALKKHLEELSTPTQLVLGEDRRIVKDPIADIATLQEKTSLTIK